MSRGLAAAGAAAAVALVLAFGDAGRAWAAFVANVLFWFGLAGGAVTLSAALTLSNAQWAGTLQRQAEAWSRPLAAASLLMLAVPAGASTLYSWARLPVAGLELWLSREWLFGRDFAGAAALCALAWAFARASKRRRGPLAVGLILTYSAVCTMLAWDLVMSLEPRWTNTLFGAYFFIGGGYAALAVLAIQSRAHAALGESSRRDLGSLLFGFCMLWSYFLWSQYLVIWYGNLPREAGFWVARSTGGWEWLGAVVILGGSVLPFVMLLARENKRSAQRLALVASVALISLWLERLLLFLPAVSDRAVLGAVELVVSVGVAVVVLVTGRSGPSSSSP